MCTSVVAFCIRLHPLQTKCFHLLVWLVLFLAIQYYPHPCRLWCITLARYTQMDVGRTFLADAYLLR